LAFDMEGFQLGRNGTTSLVQLASKDTVYLFDILTLGASAFGVGGLAAILEDPAITKLCYDCRCDAEALYYLHSVALAGAYDLQIAYTLLFQACNDPFLKGLHRALQAPGVLPAGSVRQKILQTKLEGKRHLHDMLARPLSLDVLAYCAVDVVHLFTMYELWAPHLHPCMKDLSQQRMDRFISRENLVWCMSRLDFVRPASP